MQLSRRRAPSHAYLDRTEDDPPLAWTIRITMRLAVGTPEGFPEQFVDGLRREPAVAEVSSSLEEYLGAPHLGVEGDGPEVGVRFRLDARTWEQAVQHGDAIGEHAAQIASTLVREMPDQPAWWMSISALPADGGSSS
jgi:hypothetical protein